MILSSVLLCEDVRKEVRGTSTIVGQFASLLGGLGEKVSFCIFFGVSGYMGMANFDIDIFNPEFEKVFEFTTDSVACTSKNDQYFAHFKVKDLSLSSYGEYLINFKNKDRVIGSIKFKYKVANPKDNKLTIGDKEIEVPRMDMNDDKELQDYAKLFVRKKEKLNRHFATVRFHSQFNSADGIGSVSIFLVNQMIAKGKKVKPIPFFPGQTDMEYINSIESYNIPPSKADITIVNALPPHIKHAGAAKRLLLFTYWEADEINKAWANISNTADALFVPSQYVKDVYIRAGAEKPIFVYRQPISSKFQYKPKAESEYFTILFMGTCIPRKGIDIFCRACDRVFGNDKKVRIRVHTKPWAQSLGDMRKWLFDNYGKNLKYGITDHRMLVGDVYSMMTEADLLVAPSRGEGLGLIPIQSVISGTPAIVPRHSGFKEYINTKGIIPIEGYEKVKGTGIYAGGNWYEPDFNELCDKLKFAKDNRKKLLSDVKEGSEILRRNYDANSVYLNLESMIDNVYM